MVYPKKKGGVSLFQGGLSFQHKRNQSEETNKLGSRHWMWTGNGPLTCPGLGPGACPAEPQCLGWPPCSCLSPRPRSSPCRSYALRGSEDCSVRTATPPDNCRPVHHAQPAGPTHLAPPTEEFHGNHPLQILCLMEVKGQTQNLPFCMEEGWGCTVMWQVETIFTDPPL